MRIPFDSLTLAAVLDELKPFVGGKVQKIVQPDDLTVVLNLYRGEEARWLLSADPNFARVHRVWLRYGNPGQQPPGFCQALRARLEEATLVHADQRGFDRILDLDFDGPKGPHRLTAELMGKHANLILCEPQGRVVAAAKVISTGKSIRPIQPGRPYAPPPFEPRPSALQAQTWDDLEESEGASPFFLRWVRAQVGDAPPGPFLEALRARVQARQWQPVLSPKNGAYPLSLQSLGLVEVPAASISRALEDHYAVATQDALLEALRQSLRTPLKRVLIAREVALRDLSEAVAAAGKAATWQLHGELVLAYGPSLPSGAERLEAWDYSGEPITVRLDPEKDFKENANLLFEKAKRAKSRLGFVQDQTVRLAADREALVQALAQVETARSVPELEELKQLAAKRRWLNVSRASASTGEATVDRPAYEGHRIRELLGPGGFTVLYGENATSNDYLTLRVARPSDYWLHVRGGPSAHVVIQTGNKPERVQKETLLFAAKIAAQNSNQKHSAYVAVDVTLRKYVRKPKGAPAGTALYSHEKTLHVGLEQ